MRKWIWLAALTIAVIALVGRRPLVVRWEHSGENVDSWKVCAPKCTTVTPMLVTSATGRHYEVRVSRRQVHGAVTVKACNRVGCNATVAQ